MGLFTELDSRLFHEGKNYESYKKMGAHILEKDGVSGTNFAVWAPHAQSVSVMTSKTGWDEELPLQPSEADPGIWEVFVPGVGEGDVYRYVVLGADGGRRLKSDPYAFLSELRPANASRVTELSYTWQDGYSTMYNWARGAAEAQTLTPNPARPRTWLTCYSVPYWEPEIPVTSPFLEDQIQALWDAGIGDGGFITWNVASNLGIYYTVAPAFARSYQ